MAIGPPNAPSLPQWQFNVFDIIRKQTVIREEKTASGTEVEFTSIPNWVNRIILLAKDMVHENTGGVVSAVIGTSSGYETSGYSSVLSDGGGSFTDRFPIAGNSQANDGFPWHVALTLTKYDDTTWFSVGVYFLPNPMTGSELNSGVSGVKTLSGTLDRIKIETSTGNFASGTVVVRYE